MIFSLPNGKVINLTIEEYLNLTDEDIQMLMALNYGEYPTSEWYGSSIDIHQIPDKSLQDNCMMSLEEEDEYLNEGFNINDIPDEDSDYDFINLG